MKKKLKSLDTNRTWDTVEIPFRMKTLPCKWVYKVKVKSDGILECLKAILVIKGDIQSEGIDYTESFSLIVKMTIIRCILTIAIKRS